MNSHKHARLTAKGRALLVSRVLDEGWSVAIASEAAGVSKRTGFKWLARFRSEGAAGLADRSSRPFSSPGALTAQQQGELERLRRQRWPLWRIAMQAGRGVATVSRCMRRLGLSRLKSLEPPIPVVRYEPAAAGELLHIDTKKLGRIDGAWDTALPATARTTTTAASAGTWCTWPSTTTRACRSRRCCPTRRR